MKARRNLLDNLSPTPHPEPRAPTAVRNSSRALPDPGSARESTSLGVNVLAEHQRASRALGAAGRCGILVAAMGLLCACSSGAGVSGAADAGADGVSGMGGTGGVADAGEDSRGCEAPGKPINGASCESTCPQGAAPSCTEPGKPVNSCCVLVSEPGLSPSNRYLKRTTDTKEFAGGGDPNLSCFEPATYPKKPPLAGNQMKVTLKGVVKPFANGGCEANDLLGTKVEIFRVKRTGDPGTDGALGDPVGTGVVVTDQMPVVVEDVTNCKGDPRLNRAYTYPDVPMYTELLVRSSGPGQRPLYTYNVYITEDDPSYDAGGGAYKYDVRALAEGDYLTIPTVALGQPIAPGNGAIFGEVRDCDNVRLQFAKVDISASRTGLEYFNDDEDDPLPDTTRRDIGTGRTSLYAALDVHVADAKGTFARVAGAGLLPAGNGGSNLMTLGYVDVRVFPDSVTSATLRGLRPFQVP